jgi:O-antigen biosynthesis protein WbqP
MGAPVKRLIDILLALIAAPFALAMILPLVIIIRFESKGPAFFRQTRVGRHEALFTLIKLRTMYQSTPNVPSHNAHSDMITAVGRVMRRLKLDELPQIWNVLAGHMSFVGPRPCLETQHELITARRALGVFLVRPGITGLAQVAGVDMSSPDKLAQIDCDYINRMSLSTDIVLIIATLSGRGYGDAIE